MKQVLQTIAYRSVYAVTYAVSLLPMTFLYAMASFTFLITYYIMGYRKTDMLDNIAAFLWNNGNLVFAAADDKLPPGFLQDVVRGHQLTKMFDKIFHFDFLKSAIQISNSL